MKKVWTALALAVGCFLLVGCMAKGSSSKPNNPNTCCCCFTNSAHK